MNEIFDIAAWREIVVGATSKLVGTVAAFVPRFLAMILILVAGWLVSRIVEAVATRFLHRVGIDRASERLGVAASIRSAGVARAPSAIVGRLVFWVLMLTFLLSAFETLGLTAAIDPISRLIAYVPSVIVASLLIAIGLLLARFVGSLVASSAGAADLGYAPELGRAAEGAIIVMVGVLAAEQLGLDTQLLTTVLTAIVVVLGTGIGLAFALGAREVVAAILAGHYLRQSITEGESIEVDGRRGRVERIGATDTLFRNDDLCWSVPNQQLLRSVVIR